VKGLLESRRHPPQDGNIASGYIFKLLQLLPHKPNLLRSSKVQRAGSVSVCDFRLIRGVQCHCFDFCCAVRVARSDPQVGDRSLRCMCCRYPAPFPSLMCGGRTYVIPAPLHVCRVVTSVVPDPLPDRPIAHRWSTDFRDNTMAVLQSTQVCPPPRPPNRHTKPIEKMRCLTTWLGKHTHTPLPPISNHDRQGTFIPRVALLAICECRPPCPGPGTESTPDCIAPTPADSLHLTKHCLSCHVSQPRIDYSASQQLLESSCCMPALSLPCTHTPSHDPPTVR
jgi:hypothetical protein